MLLAEDLLYLMLYKYKPYVEYLTSLLQNKEVLLGHKKVTIKGACCWILILQEIPYE